MQANKAHIIISTKKFDQNKSKKLSRPKAQVSDGFQISSLDFQAHGKMDPKTSVVEKFSSKC